MTETDLTFQLQKYRPFRWLPKQKMIFSKRAQTILIKFSNLTETISLNKTAEVYLLKNYGTSTQAPHMKCCRVYSQYFCFGNNSLIHAACSASNASDFLQSLQGSRLELQILCAFARMCICAFTWYLNQFINANINYTMGIP
jgi:hypothetical protein